MRPLLDIRSQEVRGELSRGQGSTPRTQPSFIPSMYLSSHRLALFYLPATCQSFVNIMVFSCFSYAKLGWPKSGRDGVHDIGSKGYSWCFDMTMGPRSSALTSGERGQRQVKGEAGGTHLPTHRLALWPAVACAQTKPSVARPPQINHRWLPPSSFRRAAS